MNTVDRIIDVFPPAQQQQVRVQLSQVLKTVISQQLLPTVDGALVPAYEIMHLNNAVRTMVREGGVPLETAVRMVTANPARIMGISAAKGSLEAGKDADVVLFDDNIHIQRTLIKGKTVFTC